MQTILSVFLIFLLFLAVVVMVGLVYLAWSAGYDVGKSEGRIVAEREHTARYLAQQKAQYESDVQSGIRSFLERHASRSWR